MTSRTQPVQRFAIVLLLLLAGCGLPGIPGLPPGPGMLSTNDRVNTSAARTVAAMGTRLAEGGDFTLGVYVTHTFTPTITPSPTLTPTPTLTVTPGPATATPNGQPCNQAEFVKDVTIPDGSILLPNAAFTKIWELKNTGSCTWDSSYAVVFAGRGLAMTSEASTRLIESGVIKPGETARVSVKLQAPNNTGEYEGHWLLRSGDNKTFGTGVNGGSPFFVKITVAEHYSFAEHWCSAKWTTSAGDLPCPGQQDNSRGYALRVENPTLEDGSSSEGLGLLVAPQPVAGGVITAHYPAVIVPPDSDFRATIGCQREATGCYVRFKVSYRMDGGNEQILSEWNEGNEGGITRAVSDLDGMAGHSVEFILSVIVAGPADMARAIWFDPRITR